MTLAQVIQFPNRGYDPLLTKREVAERLRKSTRTIERYSDPDYCERRGVPVIPSFLDRSGERRFRLSEVERWNEGKVA
jgi:hypothetical protein